MTKSVVSEFHKIFRASYTAVRPDKIIKNYVSYDPKCETLTIIGDKFELSNKNLYVVGTGKAVQYMARALDVMLGPKIKQGIISIPANSLMPDTPISNIMYCEGAQDNLPDSAAEATAKKIKELALSLTINDFLLVLISGGGSALLPLPKKPITLDEKLELIKKLANSGADINELNIVRKKISSIKGGKLAMAALPAQSVSLVLSDVVGDPLDIIASGPTIEDNDDVEKAISVLKKYNLYEDLPNSIREVFDTERPVVSLGNKVANYILGSNEMSILAAHNEAQLNNYVPIVLSRMVIGNVRDIAKEYVKLAKIFCDYFRRTVDRDILKFQVENLRIPGIKADFVESLNKDPQLNEKNFCLILGGEPTVQVKGTGKGGRNQQLALEFSLCIHEAKTDFDGFDIYLLSAGTDGIDGPTNAAGAIGYLNLVSDCEKANIDVYQYLENNDSYNFYKKFNAGLLHVITGHTNTNVMDTHLMIIQRNI